MGGDQANLEQFSPDSLRLALVEHGKASLFLEVLLDLDVGVLVRGIGCVHGE
jgi:hypothetical protein